MCRPRRRALLGAVQVRGEARGEGPVQLKLVVERRMGEIDEITEMGVGCLPREAREHAHVVVQEEVVLLQPGAEYGFVQIPLGDALDGGVLELFVDQRAAEVLQARGEAHAAKSARKRSGPAGSDDPAGPDLP